MSLQVKFGTITKQDEKSTKLYIIVPLLNLNYPIG